VHRTRLLIAAAPVAFALLIGGCGGGGGGGGDDQKNAKVASGARVIHVDGRSYEFDPSDITIKTGEDIAIELKSEDSFHDFVVEGTNDAGYVVGTTATAKGGLRIDKPGEYTFYCDVPGHRTGGMEGTIRVTG
jgi:plastocyanin